MLYKFIVDNYILDLEVCVILIRVHIEFDVGSGLVIAQVLGLIVIQLNLVIRI